MGFGKWLKNLFSGFKSLIARLWDISKPFLEEVLSITAQNIWDTSKDLLIEAVKYVGEQGLPNDNDKREAFKAYMKEKSKVAINDLKDSELNLLREMALAIYKKATEK